MRIITPTTARLHIRISHLYSSKKFFLGFRSVGNSINLGKGPSKYYDLR